ncbi:hypothetical protein ACWD0G_29130 [Streptomyces goshikiensis]
MKISLAANAATDEVRPISGEFALSNLLLFGCFLVLAGIVVFALLMLNRRIGASQPAAAPTRSPAPNRGVAASDHQNSMRRWTIAGVIVGAIAVVVTVVGVVHGWR